MERSHIKFLWLFLITAQVVHVIAQQTNMFDDYQQILPRGRIAAISDPEYVPANEAQIADSTWVLGVVVEGQARAYSLNLLNHHEVVNDRIDTTEFAAVW